jgi:predicted DNA-binding transcriptional regulator AlpA
MPPLPIDQASDGGQSAQIPAYSAVRERLSEATAATSMPTSPPQRHGDRASADDTAKATLPVYIRFRDLVVANIVGSWTQLLRLIEEQNFPPGRMLSRNVRAWRKDEVEQWLSDRPTGRKVVAPRKRREASPARG